MVAGMPAAPCPAEEPEEPLPEAPPPPSYSEEDLQEAVAQGVSLVFWIAMFASLLCLLLSLILPEKTISNSETS